jgi:hypothetical protein
MPKLPLDDFVQGLQLCVAQAQANIEEAERGRLERLIELAGDGRTEAVTWSFVVDGSANESGARTVRLPLVTLRRHLISQVAEVRVELRAAVEEARATRKRAPQRRLQLVVDRRAASLKKRLHRLTVRIKGEQLGKADVSIDDTPLKTVSLRSDYSPVRLK